MPERGGACFILFLVLLFPSVARGDERKDIITQVRKQIWRYESIVRIVLPRPTPIFHDLTFPKAPIKYINRKNAKEEGESQLFWQKAMTLAENSRSR